MILSHATEKTPNLFDAALSNLHSIIKNNYEHLPMDTSFEQVEKELYTVFVEAERLVLGEILEQYDINVPFIIVEEKEYRQVVRCEKTYTSAVGPVRVERSLYRAKNDTHSICPLELRTGIVESCWSPSKKKGVDQPLTISLCFPRKITTFLVTECQHNMPC